MTAIKVRIDDYEAMQDLGWTRSGTWMYHPSNDKACWYSSPLPSSPSCRWLAPLTTKPLAWCLGTTVRST